MVIRIWFEKEKRNRPSIELAVLWEVEVGDEEVASEDLTSIFKRYIVDEDSLWIDNEDELAALEELRAVVDAAIAAHKRELPE
jgi:hypothetical protein